MDIFVREINNRGVFDAYTMDGKLLVRRSSIPLLIAARSLLALGGNPDEPLRMWHVGASFPAIETTIGAASRLAIGSNTNGSLKFKKFEPGKPEYRVSEAAE
jgi:hypothetical protein